MQTLRLPLLLLFSLFLSLSWAQNEATLDSLLRQIDLEEVVVTAQYAPTAIENAVHPVRVVKAAEIQRQGFNNLAEVLSNQLNLRVSTDPILGNGLSIQGIGGENIQILIDGVPVVGRVGGNIDLSQINMQNVQQIEIIEGAMSAQYGSNASGGVVNIITKKSQIKTFEFRTQSQYEDIGIMNHNVSLGVQAGGFYASITGLRNRSEFMEEDSLRLFELVAIDSFRTFPTRVNPWNPKRQDGVDVTARYRFNDSTSLTYQYRWFDERVTSYGERKRPQFRPYAFDEFFNTERKDHSLNFESYLGKNFYINSTTAYNRFDRIIETQRIDFEPDTTSLVPGEQDTTTFNAWLNRTIISTVSSGPLNGQLGLEYLREEGSGQRILDTTSVPLNQSTLTNYAVWGSLNYDFDNFTAQANLRFGHNSKYDHPLIPSFNLSWRPSRFWTVQFSYAHGFRAPTLTELYFNFIDINHYIIGNPELKPENSRNSSLLIKYRHSIAPKQELRLSGKLFYNDIENRIILAEFETLRFNYQNVSNFETHGLNATLDYEWERKLRVQVGLSYTRLYNIRSEEFDEVDRFSGLYELQNQLDWQIPGTGTQLVLTHRYIGRQIQFFQDSNGEVREGFIGSHHLLNATLSRSFWRDRIFLAFGSKNLLDTQSVPRLGAGGGAHSGGTNSQIINWGRTYFVRVNLNF
ncbi:MAG: TonB-dependent receptor [Bacteroidota bacterium]